MGKLSFVSPEINPGSRFYIQMYMFSKIFSCYAWVDTLLLYLQVTSLRHCRGQSAAIHDADTYLCLLNSTRIYDELIVKYHGDGEDTVEKAATRVGLNLPELYEDPSEK